MATNTDHYNLKTPAQTDFYNVDDFNGNMDIVDEELFKRAEKVTGGTAGNFAALDEDGNFVDSGKKTSDFATPTALEATQSDIDDHKAETVVGETGVHGIRYYEETLQVKDGDSWVDVGGGTGIPPADCYDISLTAGNAQITIAWKDPDDTMIGGAPLVTWEKTILVRKTGSYPLSETDGTVVLTNMVRNQYADGYIDTGLANGTTYYYKLFPISTTKAVNNNAANNISGTPTPFKTFGVSIDLTNTNPASAVTYTDDAVGMTGSSPAWDSQAIFKDIKPCVLKNGVVQYYLNKNDFSKKEDGSAADITSGSAGDVMIEFPKTGLIIKTNVDTLTMTIKVTDNPSNSNFHYYAHTRATEGDCDKLYIGAYLGYKSGSALRSLSGKDPTASQTIDTFRTQAQANGDGYDLVSFFPLTLLQALYTIRFKNLDSQTALGQGYTGGSSAQTTGATNANGMNYGSASTFSRVKCLGIEDMWGNLSWLIEGLFSDSSWNILTAFDNFNDTGSGYTNRGQGATSNIGNYMSKPQGTSETGFVGKEVNGSSSTYFADSTFLYANRLSSFGGAYSESANAGVFHLAVYRSASDSTAYVGGRLMYLKKAS
jgi:hypothetical protein